MPSVLQYLAILLGIIFFWFMLLKRPVYEAILLAFITLLFATGTYGNVLHYIHTALSTSLLYSMTAFVAMSIILKKTKVIDGSIHIILALLGRVPGGAGYVATLSSAFMGALSGSGPGNVMATGVITIPAMKKSGFPEELAANVESNASYMGNMIPPSGNIVAALGALTALYPQLEVSTGSFWVILWGIALWFVLQRMLTIFVFCKIYKIRPMAEKDIPQMKQAFQEHWQGLLLPFIILVPFILDSLFKDTFFAARLGADGADYMSKSLLLFIAGVASLYALWIAPDKNALTPHRIAILFADSVKTIAPSIGVCLIGYMIGAMFADLKVAEEMEAFIISMNFGKFGMVVFICILTCVLGMVVPGSSQVVIFGSVFIATFASVGIDPVLAAAMLPCICGVMCGITPPLGLGMYAGMAIAGSDFDKTVKNNLWWVGGQFIMQIAVLMGWLPILGL